MLVETPILLRPMERQMFERGYVSARLIAAKVGVHIMTVRTICRDAGDELESVKMGRAQIYYSMKSVKKYFGARYELIDFSAWHDVVEGNGKKK